MRSGFLSSFQRLSITAGGRGRERARDRRCAQLRACATASAVDDLPDAAGPSIATTRTDPLQVAEETGIADRHGAALGQLDLGTRDRAQYAEGHRQPVVLGRVDAPARRLRGALDVQIVAAGC